MKKSLLAFAIGAVIAVGSAFAVAARDSLTFAVSAVRERWREAFPEPRATASPAQAAAAPEPRVLLVVSKALMGKLMQRMRPTVTPRWRMCPSA